MGIGARIRKIRKLMRYSQDDMATELDVSLRTLQNYESEVTDVPSKQLRIYAKYCNNINWLLTGDGKEPLTAKEIYDKEVQEIKYVSNDEAETNHVKQFPQYPICGTIPAGVAEINDLSENAEFEDAYFHPDDHFWLKIDEWYGDSMRPMIVPGLI